MTQANYFLSCHRSQSSNGRKHPLRIKKGRWRKGFRRLYNYNATDIGRWNSITSRTRWLPRLMLKIKRVYCSWIIYKGSLCDYSDDDYCDFVSLFFENLGGQVAWGCWRTMNVCFVDNIGAISCSVWLKVTTIMGNTTATADVWVN